MTTSKVVSLKADGRPIALFKDTEESGPAPIFLGWADNEDDARRIAVRELDKRGTVKVNAYLVQPLFARARMVVSASEDQSANAKLIGESDFTHYHGLHDDRCALRKGRECNCPSAAFTPTK